ncbi:hypothetical protein BJ912DRAFT_972082 [Pholiota molesta]|nr:hypothetical protein BJ912DRAFT_972082 [Pholiota molesta]
MRRPLRRLQHTGVQSMRTASQSMPRTEVSAVLQHGIRTALMSPSLHRIALQASTVIWNAHTFRPRRICAIRLAPCLCATRSDSAGSSKNAVRIHLIRFPLSSSASLVSGTDGPSSSLSHRAVRIAVIPRARTRRPPANPRLTQVRTPHTVTPARAHRLPRRRRRTAPGESSISSSTAVVALLTRISIPSRYRVAQPIRRPLRCPWGRVSEWA